SGGRAVGNMTPEFQYPFPANSGGAAGGAGQVRSGLGASALKHGSKTAGFSPPSLATAGWSVRSALSPKVTVWTSFDERLSKTMVSPGRTARRFGKYVPRARFSAPSVDGPSTTTVYCWGPVGPLAVVVAVVSAVLARGVSLLQATPAAASVRNTT